MTKIRAVDGDRIDLICWRYYGSLNGRIVEKVLEANKGLSVNEKLTSDIEITLPDNIETETREQSLW